MNLEEKLAFYRFLLDVGFKEIEVGFPAASETEYEFLRTIIEDHLIPRRCVHPGAHPVPPPHHSKNL